MPIFLSDYVKMDLSMLNVILDKIFEQNMNSSSTSFSVYC